MAMDVSEDNTLAKHKAQCFRGLVRVRLDCLKFEHQLFLNKHREESPQNVRRIRKIFEKTGCLRLQNENVIDAVVEDDRLNVALRAVGLTATALQDICLPRDAPTLDLGELKCLNGLHRIRAADQFLDENDKWWVVRLFSNETPPSILCHIVESYLNEERPPDGEIFRRIRLYRREKKPEAEKKWWARLDNSKPKDLRQLFKRTEIISGFDKLLEMPGLWAKVQLGALHRLLTLKCDEEMSHYLNRILEAWTRILTCRNVVLPFSAVDTVTVENIELLAPKNSSIDRALVLDLFKRNVIFPSQQDPQIRQELAENICSSEGLIPSLWTFFETLKYIEPICEALKKLVGSSMKRTIRSSFMACYFPPDRRNIQVAKFREAEITSLSSQKEAAWVSYVELWAFCGRYFNKLTSLTPRKESGEAKPAVEGPNPVLWQHLARFSVMRGFKSKTAQNLANSDPYTELAREYLRKSSPFSSLSYEKQVQEIIHATQALEDESEQPQTISSGHVEKERRSGRPYENDLRMDEQNLYLPNIYNNKDPKEADWTLIRRDVFNSLFGNLVIEHSGTHLPILKHSSASDMNQIDSEMRDAPRETQGSEVLTETVQCDHGSLLSQYDDLKMHTQALEAEKLNFQQRCETLEYEQNADRILTSSLQSNIQDLRRLNQDLEIANIQLKQTCQSLEDQINRDRDTIASIQPNQQEIERLRLENDTLKRKIETLETTSNQKDEMIKTSQALVITLRGDKKDLETKQATTKRELEKLKNDQSRLLEENQEHKKNIQLINDERNALVLHQEQLFAQTVPTQPEYEDPKEAFLTDLNERDLHYPWTLSSEDKYEIFLTDSNDATGLPKGISIEVEKDEAEATRMILDILAAAKEYFGQGLRAMSIQGKYLTNISPTYIFASFTMYRSILVGRDSVLERYISTGACQKVIAALSGGSLRLEPGTPKYMIEEGKKRRLDNQPESNNLVLEGEEISMRGDAEQVISIKDNELHNRNK